MLSENSNGCRYGSIEQTGVTDFGFLVKVTKVLLDRQVDGSEKQHCGRRRDLTLQNFRILPTLEAAEGMC